MEYTYALTTSYDGELVNTLRVSDMLEAVDAWTKCVDFGDAKEYATYNLSDPLGKMYTKTFYRNGEVSIR
ncbi:MAG: hypothetical protein EBR19_06465 [Chitinophagaceae bacterium]|jgi:hypothetical protein|nr:hypothetical protein [Chitinophagaceae bacterium]